MISESDGIIELFECEKIYYSNQMKTFVYSKLFSVDCIKAYIKLADGSLFM